MVKIVVLGSCRYEPYEILAVPKKNPKWNTEEGYEMATKIFYPAIDEADVIFVYVPDGIGEHTNRDIQYAIEKGKSIIIYGDIREKKSKLEVEEVYNRLKAQVEEMRGEWESWTWQRGFNPSFYNELCVLEDILYGKTQSSETANEN